MSIFSWQAKHFRDILRCKTSLCVTGTFSSAQAWHILHVAQTLAWMGQKEVRSFAVILHGTRNVSMNLDDVLTGSKILSLMWKSSFLFLDMMMIPCCMCSSSDASGSFSWQAQYLCTPQWKKWLRPTVRVKTSFSIFSTLFFSWCAQCFVRNNEHLKSLVTLCVSDRSHRSAVQILMSHAQAFRQFVCIRSLSLWCGANFDIVRASATVSGTWACRVALVLTRWSF